MALLAPQPPVEGSLTAERKAIHLPVDYERSTAQVYRDAAQYIVSTTGNLFVLPLDAKYGGTIGTETSPSWCPDWRLPFGVGAYRPETFIGTMVEHDDFHVQSYILAVKGSK